MSPWIEALGWVIIGAGMFAAGRDGWPLIAPITGLRRVTTPGASRDAWKEAAGNLPVVLLGVFFVGGWWKYELANWLASACGLLLAIWEVRRWRRRRQKRDLDLAA
jgi:hypothetical protein